MLEDGIRAAAVIAQSLSAAGPMQRVISGVEKSASEL
jgi:hypothetical protein